MAGQLPWPDGSGSPMGRDLVISVMIIGGVGLVRGALAAMLAHEDGVVVTRDLPLRGDVLGAARADRPDVVVIDLDRDGAAGVETAQQLAEELPGCRVLLLTNRHTPALLRRALAAGVWGLASPDTSPDQLAQSIRQLARGERAIDPALAAAAFRSAENPLTRQERAVLRLAGEGKPARWIAAQLYLSPGTVRNYLSSATRKTGARNRLDAARRARDAGWL